MKGLINLGIGIMLTMISFLLIATIFWLLSDAIFTFKQCVQFPPVYVLSMLLAVAANLAYQPKGS